jgi:hypothetical protein
MDNGDTLISELANTTMHALTGMPFIPAEIDSTPTGEFSSHSPSYPGIRHPEVNNHPSWAWNDSWGLQIMNMYQAEFSSINPPIARLILVDFVYPERTTRILNSSKSWTPVFSGLQEFFPTTFEEVMPITNNMKLRSKICLKNQENY